MDKISEILSLFFIKFIFKFDFDAAIIIFLHLQIFKITKLFFIHVINFIVTKKVKIHYFFIISIHSKNTLKFFIKNLQFNFAILFLLC